jgi:hypothetical protein
MLPFKLILNVLALPIRIIVTAHFFQHSLPVGLLLDREHFPFAQTLQFGVIFKDEVCSG